MKIKNKYTKLICRISFYLLSFLLLLISGVHFALVYLLPSDNIKNKIVSTLQEQLATEVSIGSISASIFDFAVNNVEIKLKNENFVYINRAYIHFSPQHLLTGKIKVSRITIDTFTLYIIKDENGKFNFEELLNSPMFSKNDTKQQEEINKKENDDEDKDIINLLLQKTQFQNISILYLDKQNNINATLTDTYFNIYDFVFNKSFKILFNSKIYALVNGTEIDYINLACKVFINLEDIDLSKASIKISPLNLRYKDLLITTTGNITNFNNPIIDLETKIKSLSSDTLKAFTKTPEFLIPLIDIKTNINLNITESILNLNSLNINMLDSTISANGTLNYSKETYDFNATIDILLDKLSPISKIIEMYNPKGKIVSILSVSNKNIKGNLSLNNISFFTQQLGDFKNINSTISINSINDIQMPKLVGELNSYPFETNLSYLLTKDSGSIIMNFNADKVIGKMSENLEKNNSEKEKEEENTTENKDINENTKQSTWTLPPFNIKANYNIKFLDIPFLRANDVVFAMNLSNVTPDLNNVKGYLKLNSKDGLIKDIYKLTEANIILKGLFMSLKIVSDVINALNVLDLLNSIGSALTPADKETKENEAIVENQKIDGQMSFDSFITDLDFIDGKSEFKKCSFVSNLLSFRVNGNINFKENILDMSVHAAPGSHEVDGVMPLTITIGGTVDNPSGSLSLLGSVSSLVGDMLTKNVVSDKLKKGFSALFGLKKCDEQGNEIKEEVISSTSTSISTTTISK